MISESVRRVCFWYSVCILYVSYRHRNANRRQYVPLQGDMGVFQAMELQRQTQKDSEKGIRTPDNRI